jgi:hypothetical protein
MNKTMETSMKFLFALFLMTQSLNFAQASELEIKDILGKHKGRTPLFGRDCYLDIRPSPYKANHLLVWVSKHNSKWNFNDESLEAEFNQAPFSGSKVYELEQSIQEGDSVYTDKVLINFNDDGIPIKYKWSYNYRHGKGIDYSGVINCKFD